MRASETVGERVRRYRRLRKLTQDALAEMADVDRRQIGRLEAGEVLEPSVDTVRRLAKALAVPVRALAEPLGWWDQEPEADNDWQRWLASLKINDDDKAALERLIRLAVEAEERRDSTPDRQDRPRRKAV